ncbi:MAG: multiheme c-type cytochrome [Nitrospinota bacterium]
MRKRLFWALAAFSLLALLAGRGAAEFNRLEDFLKGYWSFPLPPQGPPPKGFSPLEASLKPSDCGLCHKAQFEDWKTTIHAKSMGPGVFGQILELWGSSPPQAADCLTCHAPLKEQQRLSLLGKGPLANWAENPSFIPSLEGEGLMCAACHVRAHRRYGPPKRDGTLVSAPGMPHGGAKRTPFFERAEFCMPCHQHPQNTAVNGKPIENTYQEWRASPYPRAGKQCQSCHMPDRRHLWRGIHDPEMVRQAVAVAVELAKGDGKLVRAEVRMKNVGAGHYFPTYVTPAVFVYAEVVDGEGKTLPGTRQVRKISRDINFANYTEISDTRIPPGGTFRWEYRQARPVGGKGLRISVEVKPDYFYHGFFVQYLRAPRPERVRKLIEQAREDASKSAFFVYEKTFPLP